MLGEYLAVGEGSKSEKTTVKKHLYDIFSDSLSDDWIKQRCYFSILRANGREWSEIPTECALLDMSEGSADLQWELIESCQ